MRRVLLISISIFIGLISFGQAGNHSPVLIEGRVLDDRNLPVSYVNILIKSRLAGTIGDYHGEYKIVALPGDTLTFSAVAHQKTSFIVPIFSESKAYKLDVILKPDTVGLKEVVVYPWPSTYKQFRKDFLELEVKDPLADLKSDLLDNKEIEALDQTPGVPGQISLYSGPGPVSLLYDQFSKEARSRRLYAEVLKKEKAENRYNKVIITRITGLKDEETINAFMKFCPLDVNFVLQSTDYDLYLTIWNCYIEFAHLAEPEISDTIDRD